MINNINNNPDLQPFLSLHVKEHNAEADFSAPLKVNNVIDTTKVGNIQVDSYYNSLRMAETPPSIDNLVAVQVGQGRFSLYLIELKDVQNFGGLEFRAMKKKYSTTIQDFMRTRFVHIFENQHYSIHKFHLWLIVNTSIDQQHAAYNKGFRQSELDVYLSMKPMSFRGHRAVIMPMSPIPIIE